jgi:hypothetical protein
MHETIEGEVMVIDLTTGSYYSLRNSGAEIWQAVDRGDAEGEIGDALALRYAAPPAEIRSAVAQLLEQLSAEGLIEASSAEDEVRAAEEAPPTAGDGPREPFPPPVLEKHTDMQDLILLDPVHEVDARGWPHQAGDTGAG